MKRPPIFPAPQFPPVKLRLFQRMPPAVFPAIMGLFGLGLALRRASEVFGVPSGLAEFVLGATSLLWGFACLGYAAKIMQRPSVLRDEVKILPGRAGLAAMVLGLLLCAVAMLPYAPAVAQALLWIGLGLHGFFALFILHWIMTSSVEARQVTPVWHLHFVGFILGGVVAVPLGYLALAQGLLVGTMIIAIAIWGASLAQMYKALPPPPLRPLLVVHLAPPSLFGIVALLCDYTLLAQAFTVLGGVMLVIFTIRARWLTQAGFSALWGAFTFPIAAYSKLLMDLGGVWVWPGAVLLIASLGIIPLIALRVMQSWMLGSLAPKTNAATA
ncbi:MAG: tellurite resistance protein [Pseudorhodobacter sp.]|jgi:tellurite resistance protein